MKLLIIFLMFYLQLQRVMIKLAIAKLLLLIHYQLFLIGN